MNSEASHEIFAQIIFRSRTTKKDISTDVELPQLSQRGVSNFSELQDGDIFLRKISRLKSITSKPAGGSSSLRKSVKSVKHHKVIGIHDDTRHRIDFSYGNISISDTDTSGHLDLSSSSSESVEDVVEWMMGKEMMRKD